MIPDYSRRTSMRVMRTAEATVTMILDKRLNSKVNMDQTHIDLKILRVVTHRLFIYFLRNVMVNLISKEIFQVEYKILLNYHMGGY